MAFVHAEFAFKDAENLPGYRVALLCPDNYVFMWDEAQVWIFGDPILMLYVAPDFDVVFLPGNHYGVVRMFDYHPAVCIDPTQRIGNGILVTLKALSQLAD